MSEDTLRPTRAELRRAREDAPASTPAGAAEAATGSRAARRAELEARHRTPNPLRSLLTAWWFYPLLVLLVVAVVLAWRSASAERPSDKPVVVETVPPPTG